MNSGRARGPRAAIVIACALGALALVVAGCAPVTSTEASGLALAGASTSTAVAATITVDGLERNYLLHAPVRADVTAPIPLLIVIHGAGGSAAKAEAATGMTELADADGFLVAYPQGTQAADVAGEYSWNAGACCATPVKKKIDDVAFIAAMIADIAKEQPVDPEQVYVSGFSNGGMLSYRLACELPGVFAGVAVVAGALNVSECAAEGATSILLVHGTGDQTVPYTGGATNERTAKRFGQWSNASLADSAAFWITQDGCPTLPRTTKGEGVTRSFYSNCIDDTKIEVITIADGGHIWPVKEKSGFDASALITQFFGLGQPVSTLAK
jgi:polyhydroxybutyrate depolymerase